MTREQTKKITCLYKNCRKKFEIKVGEKNHGRQVTVVCTHCKRKQPYRNKRRKSHSKDRPFSQEAAFHFTEP